MSKWLVTKNDVIFNCRGVAASSVHPIIFTVLRAVVTSEVSQGVRLYVIYGVCLSVSNCT